MWTNKKALKIKQSFEVSLKKLFRWEPNNGDGFECSPLQSHEY
uniref:Uncharacterized protein n=1 Tax=Arundo donax TaxID=35708 RepID=A0A0A9DL96_ARUDO